MDRITTPHARTGPIKLAFHASRIIIDAGVLIAMGAMSMAFVTTGGADVDSLTADALPVIFLLAPVFLVTMLPDHTKPIPTAPAWVALALGMAALPYAVVKYLDAANLATTLGGSVGIGPRLLVFGTFVTLVGIGIGLAGDMLKLPSGATYPARPAGPSPAAPGAVRRRRPTAAAPAANPSPPERQQMSPRHAGIDPRRAAATPPPHRDRPIDPGRSGGPGER